MGAWQFGRTAAGTAALIAAALATWAAVGFAQPPAAPPEPLPVGFRSTGQPPPASEGEPLPPLVTDDPNVQPAQATRPAAPPPSPGPSATGSPAPRPVADPPSPMVRVQVRVPADAPPGDDLKYLITVTNASQADAHQVTVRNPLPEGVASLVKAEPKPDEKLSNAQQLVWAFGTLKAGQSKTVELVLKPKPDAKEVKNLAYVRFEHGEAVVTKINRPAVKVAKAAPKQTVKDEPFTVRVLVENTGKVPAEKVRVVETVAATAEVEAVTTGVKRTKPDANQWEWDVGTLMPGQRRVIEYRVSPRHGGEALTTTNLSADKGVLEKAEAKTVVLQPGLEVKLTGPTGVVAPGEPGRYQITVRNTGTLPSTNVRVTGSVPADCKLTTMTNSGQVFRDSVVWTVPRLEPGEAHSFRLVLKAGTTGTRVVTASATDARKTRDVREVRTLFQGAAALVWETVLDPVAIAADRNGTFTVRVKNNGGEEARNVRIEVELPPEVGFVQATPDVRAAGSKVVFGPDAVPANGEQTYTITYQARQSAQAWFRAKMTADALGDRPMQAEKAVEITGGK